MILRAAHRGSNLKNLKALLTSSRRFQLATFCYLLASTFLIHRTQLQGHPDSLPGRDFLSLKSAWIAGFRITKVSGQSDDL